MPEGGFEARRWFRWPVRIWLPVAVLLYGSATLAWIDLDGIDPTVGDYPDGIHVVDGSCVMNVSELQINITNHGLIGSQFSTMATWADAPSGQWPAGTGNEYLWAAGLWIGGIVNEQYRVSTGQFERELRPLPDAVSTIYESINGVVTRPVENVYASGRRLPDPGANDDGDRWMDEETLNGIDDDGDGRIDEDFGQLGTQMMVCGMYDNTALSLEAYPDHRPMDLRVDQTVFAFDGAEFRNFVVFRHDITNIGREMIEGLHIGYMVDCDIGPRSREHMSRDDAAGFWSGYVAATDGVPTKVEVGYMYDRAEPDPLPGYFGVMFFRSPPVRSFQVFTGNRSFSLGGDPTNDDERYELMSREEIDSDTEEDEPNDYRFLLSIPGGLLPPGGKRQVYSAMVVDEGLAGMLEKCSDVKSAWDGVFYDLDNDPDTGREGLETHLCFPTVPELGSDIYKCYAHFMDLSCGGPPNVYPFRTIRPEDFVQEPEGWCIWVNMDGCEECNRLTGRVCTEENMYAMTYWTCSKWWLPPAAKVGCTGIYGAESRVTWVVTHLPPPPPVMRVWPRSNAVHVYWDDTSEYATDLQLQMVDFESYRVLRADGWERPPGTSLENGPGTDLWGLVAEFDLDNRYYERRNYGGYSMTDTLDLGMNTGLECVVYEPDCLSDSRFDGLATAMEEVVALDVDGVHRDCPPLRDALNRVIPGYEALLPWEAYPAELDTFYLVTPRAAGPGVVGKRSVRFYEYIDTDVHNGFLYFYSVIATDHDVELNAGSIRISGSGLSGSPSVSFRAATPGTDAQSVAHRDEFGADIFVYPNPATREALAEFQQLSPNADDPTGLRVVFANLPRARSRISIFTLAGDLVATVRHDGRDGHGEVSWNLVSRSGQQVVSGIYLFVVEAEDDRFEPFTGRFVIIR